MLTPPRRLSNNKNFFILIKLSLPYFVFRSVRVNFFSIVEGFCSITFGVIIFVFHKVDGFSLMS